MPEAANRPAVKLGPAAWAGQVALYGLFALAIGVFSQWPRYHPLGPGQALIKLSFTRVGKPVGDCRSLSDAELARLPPNMRTPTVCPRERSPITVQVDVDGVRSLDRSAPPSGLSRDGASAVYERLVVPSGQRRISVQLSDDVRAREAPYRREALVTLAPGQVLVIDFDAEKGGITLQ
ncbi:MAG: hypothetical protein OEU94_10455 [Aquincola sp.]|nr:hypothetical protein [Aquincola sp.]MDH4289121.1 hypothetical protein [Aquincola sp.]MDH5329061.1 hypothetical protein [Aquincola sp.]